MQRFVARIFAKIFILELEKHFARIKIAGLSFATPITRMSKRKLYFKYNLTFYRFMVSLSGVIQCVTKF